MNAIPYAFIPLVYRTLSISSVYIEIIVKQKTKTFKFALSTYIYVYILSPGGIFKTKITLL